MPDFRLIENPVNIEYDGYPNMIESLDGEEEFNERTGMHSHRPGGFYYRRQLRRACTVEQAVMMGLTILAELESLQAWVYWKRKLHVPRFIMSQAEADEKGWQYDPLPLPEHSPAKTP